MYSQSDTHIRNKYETKKEDAHTIGTHALRNTPAYTCTLTDHTHCYAEQQSNGHAYTLLTDIFSLLGGYSTLAIQPYTSVKYAT